MQNILDLCSRKKIDFYYDNESIIFKIFNNIIYLIILLMNKMI